MATFDGCTFYMTPKKWPAWYVYEENTGNIRGYDGSPGPQSSFTFQQISGTDHYLIWAEAWPDFFMYMQDNPEGNVRCWNTDPGPQGHWIITTRDDGYVLLSSVEWPDWYIYMKNNSPGNVRGWSGDPGPQGYFFLQKL